MRNPGWRSVSVLAVIIAGYYAAYTRAQAQADTKAAAVIADVRKALGGDQKLAAMKGMSLRADYRREMSGGPGGGGGTMTFVMAGGGAGSASGSTQATGKIEIDLDMPDKYLRSDIGASGFSLTRTEGFDAGRPFLEVVPNSPGMRITVDNPSTDPARAQMALKRSNVELARLMIGLTGAAQPGFAVSYTYGGVAESPDGKADIVDVTGPDNFKLRLFVDTESHLPLMLTYMEAEPRVVMRTLNREGGPRGAGPGGNVVTAPPAGAAHPGGATQTTAAAQPAGGTQTAGAATAQLTPEQREELEKQRREAEAAPPKIVEYRMFFSDHRKVDGVSLPHRIARGTGGKTTEEWDVTSYKINPAFKADRFKVGS